MASLANRCLLLLALFAGVRTGHAQNHAERGAVPAHRAAKMPEAAKELRKAIGKHDFRFLAAGPYLPGVDGGPSHPLVELAGTRLLPGTGDAFKSEAEYRRSLAVDRYAERYNALLLAYLLKTNHPLTQKARIHADAVMTHLETAEPVADATAMMNRQGWFPSFIEVQGQRDRTPGVSEKQGKTMGNALGYQPLPLHRDFLTAAQNERLNRLIETYIRPYNRCVFAHYKAYQSK